MFGVGASTLVLAAAVVAVVTALALALAMEMRWPRIADAAEAESVSGARVLVTVGERSEMPDRQRRSSDREVPPSIEQFSETYRLLYGQLADATFDLRLLAIAGDDPFVTVSVAGNLAAVAARSGRPALLLDTDFRVQPVAKMMGVQATPGIADVLAQRLGWAGAIASVLVSRGRSIDVLPSGVLAGTMQAVADEFGNEVERLSRRYETLVLSASTPEQGTTGVAARAAGQVVVCLRRGRSTHASLKALLAEIESSGATMRGLVLWDREDPVPMAAMPEAVKRLELMG
jgi:tyrosine-protein kinase Etk/Wzc